MRCKLLAFVACLVALGGCPAPGESMSVEEAQQALEESSVASQAETLLADGVELSTNFTIGDALANAAAELEGFVTSQLPCAAITRQGAKLSIEYGGKPGACTFHGHSFGGEHSITVMRNAANEVAVHHEWNDFNDGRVSLSGSADVIWSRTTKSRHVMHEITWTILSGINKGRSGTGSGDRTQTAIEAGIVSGMRVDGTRTWDGAHGHFELDIDAVEMRWSDPVPQAGKYVLRTPSDKTLTLSFNRTGIDRIGVTAETEARSFSFVVKSDGRIER